VGAPSWCRMRRMQAYSPTSLVMPAAAATATARAVAHRVVWCIVVYQQRRKLCQGVLRLYGGGGGCTQGHVCLWQLSLLSGQCITGKEQQGGLQERS
jgi:hypothetical protein